MYITDSNQYAIELVTYLLVLVVYFYEFPVYMLLERNAFDAMAFFSQCKRLFTNADSKSKLRDLSVCVRVENNENEILTNWYL